MTLTKLIVLNILFFSIQHGISQTITSNRDIAVRYFEQIVNEQKLELLGEIFADSFKVHFLVDGTEVQGTLESHRDFLSYLFKAFPDLQYSIGDIIEEDDKLAIRLVLTGTHKSEFWGHEAFGNHIDYFSEIIFYRFENQKIKETWVQIDLCNFFQKLDRKE